MRTRTAAAALVAAALLMLTACEGGENDSSSKPDTSTQDTGDQPTQDAGTETPDTETPDTEAPDEETPDTATTADSESGKLPNLVGRDLQDAQDEAQAAGFYDLDDQDASGQGRLQVLDRNWTVCSQEPDAGTYPTDTPVILYAVKDTESC
ncbi:PASTA domain-containing protein [Streptomyces geranii]|uniref:PASTA domain-containing protein n=1 Tax=Streptomyces geranii TaxID=2058923 RepID=UPI001E61A205|nr:PASTA domain-containing protein [Streptomyces geranii]